MTAKQFSPADSTPNQNDNSDTSPAAPAVVQPSNQPDAAPAEVKPAPKP